MVQISAKIDEETLKSVGQFVSNHPYWNRNLVINAVLTTVFNAFDDSEIFDLVMFDPLHDKVVEHRFRGK